MRQHLIRRGTVAVLCALTALGLAACQGKDTAGGKDGSPAASPRAGASAAKDPAPLLTGTQLTAKLAPASFFGPGLAVDPSATQDTGGSYTRASSKSPRKPDCGRLDTTSWIGITGITGVSFTQQDRLDKKAAKEVSQEIDVFTGRTATQVFAALAKISDVCPSFTDSDTRSKVTVSEKTLAGVGDEACVITLTSPAWDSGTTLVASRVGTAVATVLVSDTDRDHGAGIAQKVVRHISGGLKGAA